MTQRLFLVTAEETREVEFFVQAPSLNEAAQCFVELAHQELRDAEPESWESVYATTRAPHDGDSVFVVGEGWMTGEDL